MKKCLCFLLVCTALFLCFTGCSKEEPKADADETQVAIDLLNSALSQAPQNFLLQVITKNGSVQLCANCTVKEETDYTGSTMNVSYSFEQFNAFVQNPDGTYQNPPSYRSTFTGSIRIQGGRVIEQDGESTNLPLPIFTVRGIRFSKEYLDHIQVTDHFFTADVTSPTAFFNTAVEATRATNMKVQVTYSDSAMQNMQITYTAPDDTAVTLTYMLLNG